MLATCSPHLFPHDVDHRSAGVVGLRLLVIVAMVGALLFVAPIAPVGAAVPTAANDVYGARWPRATRDQRRPCLRVDVGYARQREQPIRLPRGRCGRHHREHQCRRDWQRSDPEVRATAPTSPNGAATAPGTANSTPPGVAADTAGNVYVADGGNNRIQKFAADGTYLTQWGGIGTGTANSRLPGGWRPIPQATSTSPTPATIGSRSSQPNGTYLTQWGATAPAKANSTPMPLWPYGREHLRRRNTTSDPEVHIERQLPHPMEHWPSLFAPWGGG